MKQGQYPTPRFELIPEENVFKAIFNPAADTTAGVRKLANDIADLTVFDLATAHAAKLDDYALKLKRDNKAVAEYMNPRALRQKYPRDAQRVLFATTGTGIAAGIALGVAGLGTAAVFTVLGAMALPVVALGVLAVTGPDIFFKKADRDATARDAKITNNLKKIAEAKMTIEKAKDEKKKPVKPVMKDFGGTIALSLGLCLAATGIATGGASLAIFGGAMAFISLLRKAKMGYDAIPPLPAKKATVSAETGTAAVASATAAPAFTNAAEQKLDAQNTPAPAPVNAIKPPTP